MIQNSIVSTAAETQHISTGRSNRYKGHTMKHDSQTLLFADYIVSEYSKYDKVIRCFTLDIDDVDSFDIHEFTSLLVREDEEYACEATGLDNPHFSKSMLPSLSKVLKNSIDKDNQIEFIQSWKKGISDYFKPLMKEILKYRLCEYNLFFGYTNKEHAA